MKKPRIKLKLFGSSLSGKTALSSSLRSGFIAGYFKRKMKAISHMADWLTDGGQLSNSAYWIPCKINEFALKTTFFLCELCINMSNILFVLTTCLKVIDRICSSNDMIVLKNIIMSPFKRSAHSKCTDMIVIM
ncbi:unnamed protein product [Rodentolepis nana]|uniref:Deoxynucleotide monophosphate kinase n=1 Tax=Rodentolepis nana TaxID=102285 RepID=A0A0R3U048_RODNA|nr:unnamed protein product [Rodentolepis nana]